MARKSKKTRAQPRRCNRRLRGRAINLNFLIGGILLLLSLGWYAIVAQIEAGARSWPTTMGEVLESRVERRSGRALFYVPVVRYRYQVATEIYESSAIWVAEGSAFEGESSAKAFAANRPVGHRILVHYDPADPANAALFVSSSHWNIITVGVIGLVFVMTGFLPR